MEVAVAFICEASGGKQTRHHSVLIASAVIIVLILLCTFIPPLFDGFDEVTACVMMPLGALGMSLFVGWSLPKNGTKGVLHADKGIKRWAGKIYIAALRFLVPAAIVVIFLNSLGVF